MKNLSFRQSSKMKIYATSQVERLLAAYDKEARNGKEMIALNMGIPFYGMLPEIKNNLKNSLADIKNDFYSPFPGKYELRTKLAEISSEKTGSLVTADEIIITAGASSGIFNILLAILNPNEEVIVPAPYFYTYRHQVELVGGQAREVYLTLDQNNHWEIPIETVKKTINSKTRAIIINSPNNPTGAIFSEKNLRELASLVEQKEIYIICDEVYDYLIYDNQSCFNLATIKELKPYIFRCGSFSKIYGMTGWRVGYIQAAPELITVLKWVIGFHTSLLKAHITVGLSIILKNLRKKQVSINGQAMTWPCN